MDSNTTLHLDFSNSSNNFKSDVLKHVSNRIYEIVQLKSDTDAAIITYTLNNTFYDYLVGDPAALYVLMNKTCKAILNCASVSSYHKLMLALKTITSILQEIEEESSETKHHEVFNHINELTNLLLSVLQKEAKGGNE